MSFFQELRLYHTEDLCNQIDILNELLKLFENYNISKLDIKRIYRYLDKNVKKEQQINMDDDDDDYEDL
jgi:hypothetical protein